MAPGNWPEFDASNATLWLPPADGLTTGRAHLRALGASEPDMPPYDASKHEPIEDFPIEVED